MKGGEGESVSHLALTDSLSYIPLAGDPQLYSRPFLLEKVLGKLDKWL